MYRIIHTIDGRRGSFLVFIGILNVLLGLSYLAFPVVSFQRPVTWLPIPPESAYGFTLIASGVIAVGFGLVSKVVRRAAGLSYGALLFPGFTWSIAYFIGMLYGYTNPSVMFYQVRDLCLLMMVMGWEQKISVLLPSPPVNETKIASAPGEGS